MKRAYSYLSGLLRRFAPRNDDRQFAKFMLFYLALHCLFAVRTAAHHEGATNQTSRLTGEVQ